MENYSEMQCIYNENENLEIYYLKNLESSKFCINLFFVDLLNENFIIKVIIITLIMKRYKKINSNYSSSNIPEEILYSNFAVTRKGEYQVLEIFIEGKKDNYRETIEFLKNILIAPINNAKEVFNEESIEEEVNSLKQFIDSKKSNLSTYAISRFKEEMFKNEPLSIGEYTEASCLDNLNSKMLYDYYNEYFTSIPVKEIVSGDLKDDAIEYIKKSSAIKRKKVKKQEEKKYSYTSKDRVFIENINCNNENIVIGYRTNITINSKEYFAALFFNSLLGGGTFSRLFTVLRDQKLLTYQIFSLYDEFKGFIMINSSCRPGNYEQLVKEVDNQIKEIARDGLSKKEMQVTLVNLINYFEECKHDQFKGIDFYFKQILSGKKLSIDSFINEIKKVTLEDIAESAKFFKRDLVYILK